MSDVFHDPDPLRPIKTLADAIARVDAAVFANREHPAIETLRQVLAHTEDYQVRHPSRTHIAFLVRRAIEQIGGKP